MKLFYTKNWLFVNYISVIVCFFFLSLIKKDFWQSGVFVDVFLKIGVGVSLFSTFLWGYFNHQILFRKREILRSLILVVASCVVFLFTYKFKITTRFVWLFYILIIFEILRKPQFIKPNIIIFSLFCFLIFKILGVFWSGKPLSFDLFNDGEALYLLLTCVVACFFRVKKEEAFTFIAICFKGFLGLLTLVFVSYILFSAFLGKDFLSFFTLNKGYMPYYELLRWSYFKHPSYIAWIILLIGGLGYFLYTNQKEKNYITKIELILYAVLLLCLVFMLQARVAIIGYFLSCCLFFWLELSKKWRFSTKAFIISAGSVLMLLFIYFLVTKTAYFSDPIRNNFFHTALKYDFNPIFGAGTSLQGDISEKLNYIHLHNDFLSTFVDLGIIGLLLLSFWLASTFYQSIKMKNNFILYTLFLFLLIMNTDTIFYFSFCLYFSVFFTMILFMEEGD